MTNNNTPTSTGNKSSTMKLASVLLLLSTPASHAFLATPDAPRLSTHLYPSPALNYDEGLKQAKNGRISSRSRRRRSHDSKRQMLPDVFAIDPESFVSSVSKHFGSLASLDQVDPQQILSPFVQSSSILIDEARTAAQTLKTSEGAQEHSLLTPDVEAEVLTDMSHVVMDFSSFWTPSKSLIRVYTVIGRILVIFADYLPDHMIRPEELAIQVFLLTVSLREIVKACTSSAQCDSQEKQ